AVGTPRLLSLAKLGGQHDLRPAATRQSLAEQGLVVAPAVHVGAVDESDAAIDSVMDHANAFAIIALAVDAGERHAAQPDWAHAEGGGAELAVGLGDWGHWSPRLLPMANTCRISHARSSSVTGPLTARRSAQPGRTGSCPRQRQRSAEPSQRWQRCLLP